VAGRVPSKVKTVVRALVSQVEATLAEPRQGDAAVFLPSHKVRTRVRRASPLGRTLSRHLDRPTEQAGISLSAWFSPHRVGDDRKGCEPSDFRQGKAGPVEGG